MNSDFEYRKLQKRNERIAAEREMRIASPIDTVTHEEYLLLNGIQRDGYQKQEEIIGFDILKKKLWIERMKPTEWDLVSKFEYSLWQLNSAGRLEHNLYERIWRHSDGCKLKSPGCPRCWDNDPNCKICCGYKAK